MTISVIIATYNCERTIQRCLSSIAAQTCPPYEVIIVDGLSSDTTIQLAKSNKVVTKLISETDSGIYDAWNTGLSVAQGEWVMFLGADDVLDSTAVEKYTSYLRVKKNINFVSARANLKDSKGSTVEVIGSYWNYRKMRRFMNVCHTSSITSLALLKQFGMFDCSYKIAGDYEFMLRVGSAIKAGFIDDTLCDMATGGVSTRLVGKVLRESFVAKRDTGKVNILFCAIDFVYAYFAKAIFK